MLQMLQSLDVWHGGVVAFPESKMIMHPYLINGVKLPIVLLHFFVKTAFYCLD